jgi:hypothetical protein
VSKEVARQDSKKPVTFTHTVAMVAVGVLAAIIAFWVIGGVLSLVFVVVKIAVIVALIAGAFWLVSRLRR